jgi:phosphoenolpyruvate synthase/pyruvate phosphate dikinase
MLWALEAAGIGRSGPEGSTLHGVPASSGRFTGQVRVVRDESEFDKIQVGDILVCPGAAPSWSVIFPSVSAVVTEAGGILSHPAIIAREYGIPAVMAVPGATRKLKDGQRVTVDGDQGTVAIVS